MKLIELYVNIFIYKRSYMILYKIIVHEWYRYSDV